MTRHTSPYEIYAKYILETLYWERYGTLLLRDRPDLQTVDGESGIEVTSVNGEAFERLVTEIAMSKPYQAPSDRMPRLAAAVRFIVHTGFSALFFWVSVPERPAWLSNKAAFAHGFRAVHIYRDFS